jgi:hypothetical protein
MTKPKMINKFTSIEMIRVRDLSVDPSYQRELQTRRAEVIGDTLDPSRLGVLVVAIRPDGTVVIIDGQHRHHALVHAGRGDDLVRCEAHRGLSREEEAALFLKLNGGRKAIGAIDEYRAALEARVPWALEVDSIASRVGLRVARGDHKRTVQAVGAVKSVHLRQRNLEATLSVLAAWDDDPTTFNGELMKAVSIFLAYHAACEESPGVDAEHLTKALRVHAPESVLASIKRRIDGRVIKLPEAGCMTLTELYNRRAPKTKRLPPYVRSMVGVRNVMSDAAE